MARYETFILSKLDPESGVMQGTTKDGKKREFTLSVVRDLATNAIDLQVSPAFTDEESASWFEDSEPWSEPELVGSE